MQTVTRVIKNTPVEQLKGYFNERFGSEKIESGDIPGWYGKDFLAPHKLLKSLSDLDPNMHTAMAMDFDRVYGMTDDSGQQAVVNLLKNHDNWRSLENPYDRAMWLFINDIKSFNRAEEIRYIEHNRRGQKWVGYIGPKGLKVSDSDEHRKEFEERLCKMFNSSNAHLEIYDRLHIGLDGESSPVTQAVIYREGLPNSFWAFNNSGAMERKPIVPVLEAVITYDSKDGTIEMVGMDAKSRPRLVQLFSEVLLRRKILGMRLPLRRYDLSSLIEFRNFKTDPKDGISSVQVLNLKIQFEGFPGFYMDLIRERDLEKSLYEFSKGPLGDTTPLCIEDLKIIQAELAIRFRPDRGARIGKLIKLTITLPDGCNLKGKNEKERLICEKYLPRWGLVKNV